MGEIILPNAVNREEGYLYYIDGEGNIGRAKLKRGGTKKIKEEENQSMKKIDWVK